MAHPHSNAPESVLAHIATAKYYDHLPLHRQLISFEREGIHLSPSTVSNDDGCRTASETKFYNDFREPVKDSYYVMADETPPSFRTWRDRPVRFHRGYIWNFYCSPVPYPLLEYHSGPWQQRNRTHCWQDSSVSGYRK